jgi:hypothetical protein
MRCCACAAGLRGSGQGYARIVGIFDDVAVPLAH